MICPISMVLPVKGDAILTGRCPCGTRGACRLKVLSRVWRTPALRMACALAAEGSTGGIRWVGNGHSVAQMEPRQHMLRVKLSDAEKEKLEAAAAARGWTVSQLIRDFIWQLPEKPA